LEEARRKRLQDFPNLSVNMRIHNVDPLTGIVPLRKNRITEEYQRIQEIVHPLLVEKPKSPEEKAIKELQKEIEKFSKTMLKMQEEQNKMYETILKLSALIVKLHAQGEINQDTFNKMDDFLKPYYDNENLLEDY